MVTRRAALVTLGLSGAVALLPRTTLATVARAMSIKDLTDNSRAVLLGEPVEAYGEWTRIGEQDSDAGVTRVTAMAQGHYRVLSDAHCIQRLKLSPRLATLLPNKFAAVERLKGKTFAEARDLVLEAPQP